MSEYLFLQLLQPLTYLIFAAGFAAIYMHSRHLPAARLWSISYLCGAIAFSIDMSRAEFSAGAAVWTANAFYLASAGFFTAGHFARRGKPMPFVTFASCAATVLICFAAFNGAANHMVLRMIVLQIICGIVLALPIPFLLARTRRGLQRMLIDRIAGWLLVAFVAQFFVRATLLTTGWMDPLLTAETYFTSTAAITLRLALATMAVASAVVLYVMLGIEMMADLHHASRTDGLTKLLNKTSFEEDAREALSSRRARDWPVSLIVCDIDHFKAVNDTHGHAVGDRVIVTFAEAIAGSVRENDLCGRIGGEEFAVLLKGCPQENAATLAEGIRAKVEAIVVPNTDGLCFRASFGVASLDDTGRYLDLFERADGALYEAKEGGRNRVVRDVTPSGPDLKLVAAA